MNRWRYNTFNRVNRKNQHIQSSSSSNSNNYLQQLSQFVSLSIMLLDSTKIPSITDHQYKSPIHSPFMHTELSIFLKEGQNSNCHYQDFCFIITFDKHFNRMFLNQLIFSLPLLLTTFTFTPEIIQLQYKIAELSYKNQVLSQKRQSASVSSEPQSQHLPRYSLSQLKMHSLCKISGKNMSVIPFQTEDNLYFAVNLPHENNV